MAARFDIYDLSSPFVSATAPTPTAAAAPQAQAQAQARRFDVRLLQGGAYLLTLAGVLLLAALLAALTPLGRIDADITVPFVAVLVGALALIAWRVTR